MKPVIIFSIIIAALAAAYFVTKWLQTVINPRQSLQKLLLYLLSVLAVIFIVSFIMVFIIGRIYPAELVRK